MFKVYMCIQVNTSTTTCMYRYIYTRNKYIQYTGMCIVCILEFPLIVQRTQINNYYYYPHSYQRNKGKQ